MTGKVDIKTKEDFGKYRTRRAGAERERGQCGKSAAGYSVCRSEVREGVNEWCAKREIYTHYMNSLEIATREQSQNPAAYDIYQDAASGQQKYDSNERGERGSESRERMLVYF